MSSQTGSIVQSFGIKYNNIAKLKKMPLIKEQIVARTTFQKMRGTLLILLLLFFLSGGNGGSRRAAAAVQNCCTTFVRSCKAIVKCRKAQSQRPQIDMDLTITRETEQGRNQSHHKKYLFVGS